MSNSPLGHEKRLEWMRRLGRVAREVGQSVLKLPGDTIFDTGSAGNSRQFSTVDSEASRFLRTAVAHHMGDCPPNVVEEVEIARDPADEASTLQYPLLIADAVEGSTNAKRGLTACISMPIAAGTSLMILENDQLSSIAASAFYDFASGRVYSAVRSEPGSFTSFVDERLITRSDVEVTRGDTQLFVAVPGYSHGNVEARCQLERVLRDAGFCITGGSRSSAQDLLHIASNQTDASVDLRACFPGTHDYGDAVLHPWDVGGLLPFMDGLGFVISDPHRQSWQSFSFFDPLALVVARPGIGTRILDAISQLPFVAEQPSEPNVISVTTATG